MASGPPNPADDLSSRHRATLRRIFERPNRPDIAWRDVLSLFRALGAEIEQGRGSRIRVFLNGADGGEPECTAP